MIKIDMEMPSRCDDCNFAVEDKSGELICVAYDEGVEEYDENKPEWCPLSECDFCGGVSKVFGALSPLLEKK